MMTLSQIVTFIADFSNLIGTGLWWILQLSSYVGRNLVNQIVYILDYLTQLFQLIIFLLCVICEDFLVFYRDIGEKASLLASLIINGISHITDGVTQIFSSGFQLVTKTLNFTSECVNNVILGLWSLTSFLKTCIDFVKEALNLVGSSIWLAVTKTPIGILNSFIWTFLQIRNLIYEIILFFLEIKNLIISIIKNCFMCIFNIPHSSFFGLLIGLIIFYTSARKYRTVLSVILRISRSIYCFLSTLCGSFRNRNFFDSRRHDHLNSYEFQDKLCIVCQDRLKEVITLPCRHLCLCIQCSLHIAKNYRICPICRSEIHTTMKVYI